MTLDSEDYLGQLVPPAVTSRGAAEMLGVSLSKLNYMHKRGIGPRRIRIGGTNVYRVSDVLEYRKGHPHG